MTKKVLWAIAAVGAVALVLSLWLGSPSVGPGTEATVGAAKRSVAPQADSVALGSMDVQQFLQSDTFDKLMRNSATRAILVKAAHDQAFRDALTNRRSKRRSPSPRSKRRWRNLGSSRRSSPRSWKR